MRRKSILILLTAFFLIVLGWVGVNFLSSDSVKGGGQIIDLASVSEQVVDRNSMRLRDGSLAPGLAHILDEIESSGEESSESLAIDRELQTKVYQSLEQVAVEAGYVGGAGIIMDVRTGELLTLTSYPEVSKTGASTTNLATHGQLVPGSIIKPFIALAALNEGVIEPETKILSTGSIELPNPYYPDRPYVYKDWKAHGYVDMREAIGVSSNVYFYTIGGGYEDQSGLGIENIKTYLEAFGIGQATGIEALSEKGGRIPDPNWKEKTYGNDEWRLGDTYLVAIGQHGYEVTPLQMVRAVAGIATNGELPTPTIYQTSVPQIKTISIPIKDSYYQVVKEGMKYAVTNGTASGLYLDGVPVAAKTGTAEADTNREKINSWLIGYFPVHEPRYAFAFVLESGPWGEETGSVTVAYEIFTWLRDNRPYYLQNHNEYE